MARSVSSFFVTVIVCNVLVQGQTPTPTVPAGVPPAGTPPAGVPPAGTPPAGVPPAGTPPAGIPPAGTSPALPLPQVAPECATLNPIAIDQVHFKTGETVLWLGKIYVGPASGAAPATPAPVPAGTPPAPAGTPPAAPCADNKCSITSYTPDTCQSVKMIISRNEDGAAICFKEATYNKVTNSVSLIKNTWLLADASKAMYKQSYGYYATVDQSSAITIVDPAPEDVKTSQNKDLVILGAGENGEWTLFSTCCKSTVFVLYDDATVAAQGMKNFDAAITPLLEPLGIKPEDLKDVCTDMPIKLDAYIPVLPAAPAAAGTPPAGTPPAGTPPAGTPPAAATPVTPTPP